MTDYPFIICLLFESRHHVTTMTTCVCVDSFFLNCTLFTHSQFTNPAMPCTVASHLLITN